MSQEHLLDDRDEFWTPTMLWAPPGIGKSSRIKELLPNVLEFKLSEIDISDIRGLPVVPHGGEDALRR